MAYYTRSDLILRVLYNLGRSAADETPPAEDTNAVDAIVDACADSLSRRGIYSFGDVGQLGPINGSIESQGFLELAHIVAFEAGAAFNIANDPALITLATQAEERLRIIGAPSKSKRFLDVDKSLLPRRLGYPFYNGGVN